MGEGCGLKQVLHAQNLTLKFQFSLLLLFLLFLSFIDNLVCSCVSHFFFRLAIIPYFKVELDTWLVV